MSNCRSHDVSLGKKGEVPPHAGYLSGNRARLVFLCRKPSNISTEDGAVDFGGRFDFRSGHEFGELFEVAGICIASMLASCGLLGVIVVEEPVILNKKRARCHQSIVQGINVQKEHLYRPVVRTIITNVPLQPIDFVRNFCINYFSRICDPTTREKSGPRQFPEIC